MYINPLNANLKELMHVFCIRAEANNNCIHMCQMIIIIIIITLHVYVFETPPWIHVCSATSWAIGPDNGKHRWPMLVWHRSGIKSTYLSTF